MNPVQEAHRLEQAIWIDYIRRGLLRSGELQQLVKQGIKGNRAAISRLASEQE